MKPERLAFEPLDLIQMAAAIDENNLEKLKKLEIFDTIDSTNTYLLQQADKQSGWVCFAEQQTCGRGRRGREWFSPRGSNIYCSMLWQFEKQDVASLSIAVAVMMAEVLKKSGIVHGIALKWPNDVLYSGRKLAGILLERTGSFVVIGIGLNLYLPQETEKALAAKSIDLMEIMGGSVQRNFLAGLLVNELLAKLPIYAERGLSVFLNDWCQYDALFNQKISVHTGEKIISGEMKGINASGELLLLDDNNQLHHFRCGEVTVRASDYFF